MRLMTVGFLAAAVAGVLLSTSGAKADSVSLDTLAGSNWQVQRVLVGGETNSGGTSVGPVQNVASIPWSFTTLGGASQWVSWDPSTGNGYTGDVNGTNYIYTDTFTVVSAYAGPANLQLTGTMAFDNYVSGVTLYDSTDSVYVPITLVASGSVAPGDPTEFGYVYTISANATYDFTSPASFVLTVTGVNSYGPDSNPPLNPNSPNPGPTGFIMSGTAVAVPVPMPAAFWTGMSTLLGVAGLGLVRRRRPACSFSHN